MKAVVYRFGKGLSFIQDQKKPLVRPGHVVIQVCAAAINPVDYKLPTFLMHNRGVGLDVAGIVTAVGKGVAKLSVGDAVFGNTRGALAEFALCDTSKITKKPEGLSFVEAAAIPTTYLTGYQALKNNHFKRGSKLLVIGASGGCGTAGVQLGSLLGAEEIVGICSQKNAQLALKAGATKTVDYNTQNALEIFGKGYFDFVYDTATASGAQEDYVQMSISLLKDVTGLYVCINGSKSAWFRRLFHIQKKGFRLIMTQHSATDLEQILKLMMSEINDVKWRFRPVIDSTFPFDSDSVVKGFNHLRSRRATGKIVFNMEVS